MAVQEKRKDGQLEMFLSEFKELTIQTTKEALKLANDEDEKAVIEAFSPTLINQVTELNNFLLENSSRSSRQQIMEVEQVLKVTSGISLANNAKSIFPSLGSIIGKLGLSRIIKEIKKIVRAILEAFGIKLPKWIDALLNIIDEIFDAIFGAGSSKLATILSIQEQNYLAELTQLAKLQQANQFKYQEDNEDD
jgi:hypothetical protein